MLKVIIGNYGTYRGATFQIEGGLTFGRDVSQCNVVIPENDMISEKHCRVQELGGRIYLTDLGSANGTFLSDGKRLTPQQPVELHSGDIFYLADTGEQFQVKGDPLVTDPVDGTTDRTNPLSQLDPKKKKLLFIGCIATAVIILIIALVAGNKKDPIIGVWEGTYRDSYTYMSLPTEYEFEFFDNGFMTMKMGDEKYGFMTWNGKYKTDGSSITIALFDDEPEEGTYEIKGNKMELTYDYRKIELERKK